MKTKKLLKVAHMLENLTVPEQTLLDMDYWRVSNRACGTTMCALGYAVDKGLFKNLDLVEAENSTDYRLTYKGKSNWQAVCELFDLTMQDASELFYGNIDDTVYSVASRIRQKVATYLSEQNVK